jgi:hypothetical protein
VGKLSSEVAGANVTAIGTTGDRSAVWRDTPLTVAEARALLRYAVAREPSPFDPGEIAAWLGERFPRTDPRLIEGLLIGGTVNDPRRQHFPEPDDVLFCRDDGRYERFDPSVHGRWTKSGRPRLASAPHPPGTQAVSAPASVILP